MTGRSLRGVRAWPFFAIFSLAFAAVAELPQTSRAGEQPPKQEQLPGSLDWIPQDASFYSAALRLGEQVEIIRKSRAWENLRSLPAVHDALEALGAAAQSSPGAAQLQALRENPEVQRALALLGEMFSQEAFVYAGPDMVDVVDLLQKSHAALNVAPLVAALEKAPEDGSKEGHEGDVQSRIVLRTLAENADQIKVANLLFGFKVRNRDRAVEGVARWEGVMNLLTIAVPNLTGKIKRTTIAGTEYVTVTVDHEVIPWDKVREKLARKDVRKEDLDKIFARLEKLTLVVAVGVRKDYLLVLIGPSTDLLTRFNEKNSLDDLPAFRPYQKFADRRLTRVSYLNEAMAMRLMDNTRSFRLAIQAFDRALPEARLPDADKAEIRKDLGDLTKDLERVSPKPGAMTSFDFLMERGIEGYTYTWGSYPMLVGGKPLEILGHVGGHPTLMGASRSKISAEDYDLLVKWFRVARRYFEKYAVPKMKEKEQSQYKEAVQKLGPLGDRFNDITRNLLIPSLDGQIAVAIDAQLKIKQFLRRGPAFDREMPMAEPALVVGLNNADQFRKAMGEYRKLFNEFVAAVRQMQPDPEKMPKIEIPEPKEIKTDAGTLYVFPLPEEWGVTEQIVSCLGISGRVAAWGITQDHVRRLLADKPLEFGGVLADPKGPKVYAFGLDGVGLVDAITPWVEYALRRHIQEHPAAPKETPEKPEGEKPAKKPKVLKVAAEEEAAGAKPDKPEPGKDAAEPSAKKLPKEPPRMSNLEQARIVLDALKTLRSITAESHLEDNVLVSHRLIEIQDVAKPAK